MIKHVRQNLFDSLVAPVCVAHVTNNKAVMGAGLAKQLKSKFGIVPPLQNLGSTSFEVHDGIHLAHMCAQDGFWTPGCQESVFIRYAHLIECMKQVSSYCGTYDLPIVCPKFGSGLAGGNWSLIELYIEELWSDLNVTVFSL